MHIRSNLCMCSILFNNLQLCKEQAGEYIPYSCVTRVETECLNAPFYLSRPPENANSNF